MRYVSAYAFWLPDSFVSLHQGCTFDLSFFPQDWGKKEPGDDEGLTAAHPAAFGTELTLVTPEDAPLALFGPAASEAA